MLFMKYGTERKIHSYCSFSLFHGGSLLMMILAFGLGAVYMWAVTDVSEVNIIYIFRVYRAQTPHDHLTLKMEAECTSETCQHRLPRRGVKAQVSNQQQQKQITFPT
jgi:hypothetical protein